nr:longitudinals lacking protein, isoforms H/M/V-like [Megalopta genalis]
MMEETVLSLKWQSFSSHLAVSLDTCYEKQQFVDLSLVCKDGTIIKCHKMVLANASTFFRRLLVANDHPHPMIILHDIEADDLKTIVNFMYCGEIQVVQSEVRRLLKLAEILEVTGLKQIQTKVLGGETYNNSSHEPARKTATVSRSKNEETKGLLAKTVPESEPGTSRSQIKACPTTRSLSALQKSGIKAQEVGKKSKENMNLLSQRLETGKSGISILDAHDMPSTSRGIPDQPPQRRKEPPGPVISWPRILSEISKDHPLPKKLCIMDEVEITAGKPPPVPQDSVRNEPLDRRKQGTGSEAIQTMNCAVYIKDELDICHELDEDEDMDPLEVEELENESPDEIPGHSRRFSYTNIDQIYNTGSLPEFPPRKGSNG